MGNMIAQLLGQFVALLAPGAQDDKGMDGVTFDLMRQANGGSLGDGWMTDQALSTSAVPRR